MGEVSFPAPTRVVIDPDGERLWAYVVGFDPGRVWVVPGVTFSLGFGDSVTLSFINPSGPPMRMSGTVTWLGADAIGVDVGHAVDRSLTTRWAAGEEAWLPGVGSPRSARSAA